MSQNSDVNFDDLWDYDLWDYNAPVASEATLRALLPAAETTGNPSYVGEVQTQLARAQGLQRKFDAAHATLDRVETMVPDARLRTRIRYLLERGRVYNTSGFTERASPLFREAWERSKNLPAEGYYAVDAAHMLAIVGAPDEQIAWNQRGIELAVASDDDRVRWWCASLCNNLGWTYNDMGEHKEALAWYEKALEWREQREQRGKEREIRIARWNVGRALRMLGRYDEALALQRALLAEWEASSEEQAGYVSEELGECLLALNRADESRPHFAHAYTLLARDEWLREAQPERLARMKRLGEAPDPSCGAGS
jgi:tetratricopeptide (TPR) repeat protein